MGSNEISIALQTLAREEMKIRLLQDVLTDITISKHEGWDYKQYLLELKTIIDGFLKKGANGKIICVTGTAYITQLVE